MLALLMMTLLGLAASLPGVPLPFEAGEDGRWVLSPELPQAYVDAGASPGWILEQVDGVPFLAPLEVQRMVATGPARNVRLLFQVPAPPPAAVPDSGRKKKGAPELPPPAPEEVLLVVPRSELVRVETLGLVPWPEAFAVPAGTLVTDARGRPAIPDRAGAMWLLDPASGGLVPATGVEVEAPVIPDLFWSLSDAMWVIDRVESLDAGDAAFAHDTLTGAARLRSFQGRVGDHLVLPATDGLLVLTVGWPSGTPQLPTCSRTLPEGCLTAGQQILADLADRKGATTEARRMLGIACEGGVYRACYEADALEDSKVATQVGLCLEGEIAACTAVARQREALNLGGEDRLISGMLEYACDKEGEGSLGERLRRLSDVGEGCMMLSRVLDTRGLPDQALITLDRACVLGRADACEQATDRRHQAFAARIVRECESPELPVAGSCVDLGSLLQKEEVEATRLDDFGAFLRGCTLGAEEGCVRLGDYVDRWGIENPRVAGAQQQLQDACGQGEVRACVGAAHLLVRQDPKTDAYPEALLLFVGACEKGVPTACVAGAQQRRIGKARKTEAPSQLQMWGKACDLNSADGCAGLGERLVKSSKLWPETYTAWTRACDLGGAHACTELGRLVTRKHDEPWPGEQAPHSYLQRGCDNGDPEGCYWLAEDQVPKRGEPPEPAYLLLDRSCEGEYGLGCAVLADVHLDRGTSFDDEIAARHLDTACANGEYESCKVLGDMYRVGKGVEKDRQRANELLDKFRFNASRRFFRVGLTAGIAQAAGGEAELVIPIPVGPALSIGGNFSYIPGGGSVVMLLDGQSSPTVAPDFQYMAAIARIYGNHQARGAYAGFGLQWITASGGDLGAGSLSRNGWSARVGVRNDSKFFYTGIEVGLGQFGIFDLNKFDSGKHGSFPLLLPVVGMSLGLAPF